jgi:hypothetical protein
VNTLNEPEMQLPIGCEVKHERCTNCATRTVDEVLENVLSGREETVASDPEAGADHPEPSQFDLFQNWHDSLTRVDRNSIDAPGLRIGHVC